MAKAEIKGGKKALGGEFADIYTALLGLAVLAVAATTLVVCLKGMEMFGTFFTVLK